jgi:hypothetical protein
LDSVALFIGIMAEIVGIKMPIKSAWTQADDVGTGVGEKPISSEKSTPKRLISVGIISTNANKTPGRTNMTD